MAQVFFTIFVCLYAADFYSLSDQNAQGKPISILEAVRISRPDASLVSKLSKSNTVITLPGAIKSEGKKFDPDPEVKVVRDPNTLPGALDLVGSFDENSVDIVPKNGRGGEGTKDIAQGKVSKSSAGPNSSATPQIVSTKSSKGKATGATSTESKGSSDDSEATSKKQKKKKRKNKKSLKRKKKSPQVGHKTSVPDRGSGSQSGSPVSTKQKLKNTPQPASSDLAQVSEAKLYDGPRPMNRHMEELQVPAKTGVLEESAIRETYGTLVKAYLKPFEGGINRRSFFELLRRKTYSLTPPGANKGIQTILFQIISKSKLIAQLPRLGLRVFFLGHSSRPF